MNVLRRTAETKRRRSEDKPDVAAFGVSQPDAGSDVSSLRARAKYNGATDEWVLNGQTAWATNGAVANVHVVVAQVDPELKARGHASFVIPPETKGLEMLPVERMHRDAKIYSIFEGTSEIQRMVIAAGELGNADPLAAARRRRDEFRCVAVQGPANG